MMLAEPGDPDRRLEREELLVAQLARADVDRRLVEAALGQAVADHVLARGEHAVGEVRTLQRRDVGAAELGGQVRVLAVGLLDPAPARVAGDVEDGRESVPGAGQRASAGGSSSAIAGTSSGSKLAAAPIDCWKHGARAGDEAVEALLVDDGRDPEARLLDEVALDRVGGLGDLGRRAGWSSPRAG